MSLINEALKKAQKQRTGESQSLSGLPSVGGEPAARIARRAKPVGFGSLITRIGLGAGAVVLLVVAGIFLAKMLTSQPAAPAPASAKATVVAATEPAAKPTDIAAEKPVAPAASNAFVLPVAAAPVTPAPVVAENKPAAAAVVVPPPPPPKPVPAAKLEPKAITYIENIRVAGIRASGGDSKVLMNDRVYRVGDTVEHELGLKLTGITSNSLSFEDERGAKYTRNF